MLRRGGALVWPLALVGCAAWALGPLAEPAGAWAADPGASTVAVQAPTLAPGVWGSAPVSGQMGPSGAFSLSINGAQASTGSTVYDAVVRRTLGQVTVAVASAVLLGRTGVVSRYRGMARVGVAGRVVSAPLTYKVTTLGGRRVLNAFVVANLDAYGIRSISGGPAGPLRASARVSFPTP